MEQKTILLPRAIVKQSTIHGMGLFAEESIKKDQLIVEYKGELISGDEGDRRSVDEDNPFIMCFDDEYDIDGNCEDNFARFINHSCEPNVEFEVRDGKMWCFALRDINAGEELTTDYEMDCDELLACHCKKSGCRKYQNHPEDIPGLRNM